MRRPRATTIALGLALATAAAASAQPLDAEALLRDSDPFSRAPASFRVELAVTSAPGGRETLYEIWRSGEERMLVRFLERKDRGKFVLRRGRELYFLAPGARRPVRLAPALAPLAAMAFDQLLGLRLERDYRIADVTTADGQARFELAARDSGRGPEHLRWIVDIGSRRPLRAEILDARGKVSRMVIFRSWSERHGLEPEELVATDVARGTLPVEIRLLRLETRPVPEALFDLEDSTARAALEQPEHRPAAP